MSSFFGRDAVIVRYAEYLLVKILYDIPRKAGFACKKFELFLCNTDFYHDFSRLTED